MQPYFLPYIGYFQLMNEVDLFIIYDDVNYIKRGWVNRNRIQINGEAHFLTLPLVGASQNKLISEIELAYDSQRKSKHIKTIRCSYSNAPFFIDTFRMIECILESKETLLVDFLIDGLKIIARKLGIQTPLIRSSECFSDCKGRGQERILSICKNARATHYINPINGIKLYNSEKFISEGIQLAFIRSVPAFYKVTPPFMFIPFLSIVDEFMFNDLSHLRQTRLKNFELIKPEIVES